MQREEALEVAMLAKAVGSHLVGVDQLTVERSASGGPANKINMQNFIAPLVGKQSIQQHHEYGANPEIVKAYQGLNELALQSIPDVGMGAVPDNVTPLPSIQSIPVIPQQNVIQQPQIKIREQSVEPLLTRSDIDSIRNSLKGIDKSLAALLNYMKNSKK
jgi:hypothetical protein